MGFYFRKDYLLVKDGKKTTIGRFCGRSIPKELLIKGNSVTFIFKSNKKNNFPGFTIAWTGKYKRMDGEQPCLRVGLCSFRLVTYLYILTNKILSFQMVFADWLISGPAPTDHVNLDTSGAMCPTREQCPGWFRYISHHLLLTPRMNKPFVLRRPFKLLSS